MKRLRGCTLPVALLLAAGSGLERAEGKPEDPTRREEGYMWRWLDDEDADQAPMPPFPEPPTGEDILALIDQVPNVVAPLAELLDEELESDFSIVSGSDDFVPPDSPWENSEGAEQQGPGDDGGSVEVDNVSGADSPGQGDEEAQSDSTGHG